MRMPLAPVLCALLSAFARPDGTPCESCDGSARRSQLCALHAEIETETLRDLKRLLRSKDAGERGDALRRAAELTHSHVNAPSPAVARFVAEGLADTSLAVRGVAVKLLAQGQHRDESARALIRALEDAKRAWNEIEQRVVDPRTGAIALDIEELTEVPAYFESVLEALGGMRDERALQALTTFLRSPLERTPGRFLVVASRATLALDTRRGVEAVTGLFERMESALAKGAVPRRFPRPVGRSTLLDVLKERLDNAADGERDAVGAELASYVTSKGLPPVAEPANAAAWREWFDLVRNDLPERVAQ